MKVFISWSGERSMLVAELLDVWIKCVIQAVEPWLSSKDVDRGALWFSEISNQLAKTHNGIICLTKTNKDKPWILFEAGALAKGLSSNRVFTFLIDLEHNDIKDPLAQFNHTTPDKKSVHSLVKSINNGLLEDALDLNILNRVFETYWPQFEKDFKNILKDTPAEEIAEERPKEDIINEILFSVRNIDKRLRHVESESFAAEDIRGIDIINLPIEDLDISVRTYNSLKAHKINKLSDFTRLDPVKIFSMKMINLQVIEEINNLIESQGISWLKYAAIKPLYKKNKA